MIFGFIEDAINTTVGVVEDAVDISLAVVTLGELGELSKKNVSRLIAGGLTIYEISEASGIAIDVIEKVMED